MTDGVIFSYRGSWCAEGFATTWESSWRAIGQRGTACWEGDTIRAQAVSKEEGFIRPLEDIAIPARPVLAYSGHAGILRECIDSLYNKTMPQTQCLDNIKSLAMVHAAIESADRGEKVLIQ
jgi:predicted dehydrogenase